MKETEGIHWTDLAGGTGESMNESVNMFIEVTH